MIIILFSLYYRKLFTVQLVVTIAILISMNIHCESEKNWATFIFTVTLANVGRFLKFFHCRNQKEMAHNKNEKFPTVA